MAFDLDISDEGLTESPTLLRALLDEVDLDGETEGPYRERITRWLENFELSPILQRRGALFSFALDMEDLSVGAGELLVLANLFKLAQDVEALPIFFTESHRIRIEFTDEEDTSLVVDNATGRYGADSDARVQGNFVSVVAVASMMSDRI